MSFIACTAFNTVYCSHRHMPSLLPFCITRTFNPCTVCVHASVSFLAFPALFSYAPPPSPPPHFFLSRRITDTFDLTHLPQEPPQSPLPEHQQHQQQHWQQQQQVQSVFGGGPAVEDRAVGRVSGSGGSSVRNIPVVFKDEEPAALSLAPRIVEITDEEEDGEAAVRGGGEEGVLGGETENRGSDGGHEGGGGAGRWGGEHEGQPGNSLAMGEGAMEAMGHEEEDEAIQQAISMSLKVRGREGGRTWAREWERERGSG